MSIFVNKKEFEENYEIFELLDKLEKAHKNSDELACMVLLTKLNELNIKVESVKKND